MLKKLFISLIIALLPLPLIATPALAQLENLVKTDNEILMDFCKRRQGDVINLETWYAGKCNPGESTFQGEGVGFGDIIFLHLYELLAGEQDKTTLQIIKELKTALESLSYNSDNSPIAFINTFNQAIKEVGLDKKGLLGQAANLIELPYKYPPVSTTYYLAGVQENLSKHRLVQPAYAQEGGYGFQSLGGILPIWRAFRNMSYLFFVLIFVVYGFMIMFRVKINPQTAANIQMALPKLVITLLLITFSFAIVGLMFDLMWVFYTLIINALTLPGGVLDDISANWRGLVTGEWNLFLSGFINAVVALFVGIPTATSALIGLPGWIGLIPTAIITVLSFIPTIGLLSLTIAIIVIIAVFIAIFKLFIKLVGAYVSIVISVVTAPIILIGNIFPGSTTVGDWLRNIIANLSVFPITSLFLLFSFVFMVQPILQLGVEGELPATPVLFIGGADAAGIMALIGLALLLMAPKYVDIVRDALKVPPFKYGEAIGETLLGGVAGTIAAAGYLQTKTEGFGGRIAPTAGKIYKGAEATGKAFETMRKATGK